MLRKETNLYNYDPMSAFETWKQLQEQRGQAMERYIAMTGHAPPDDWQYNENTDIFDLECEAQP